MKNLNSDFKRAEEVIFSLAETLKKKDYAVSDIIKKQYNFEISITRGKDKLKLLVYFGKKGISTILQGNKETKLYAEIYGMVYGSSLDQKSFFEIEEPDSYIGTDESGKGDYFGPLVISGVYVDPDSLRKFKKLGVKDSKELSDNVIRKFAEVIRNTSGVQYEIINIIPSSYNKLYAKIGNVNRILGWGHAKVLENLLERCPAVEAISDKFGDESLINDALQSKGKRIILHQFTKAERFTAVAAASILARDKFNSWFDDRKRETNIDLLKGASAEVEKLAAGLIAQKGKEYLADLVKLHFKTTTKIIRSNY